METLEYELSSKKFKHFCAFYINYKKYVENVELTYTAVNLKEAMQS